MSEAEFYNESFISREISFTEGIPSEWILVEKLGHKHSQLDQYEFLEFNGAPSAAYGVFLCENADDPADIAIVRICMQIPYTGSEIAVHAERARQAHTSLNLRSSELVDTLETLTKNNCQSTPTLINSLSTTQGDDDIVPNGFIVYLLMNRLTGVQLDANMERHVRDEIRMAFKCAYMECIRAGIALTIAGLKHIFYDATAGKINLLGFRDSRHIQPDDKWKDTKWIAWELAKAPRGYRWYWNTEAHPDMTYWKL